MKGPISKLKGIFDHVEVLLEKGAFLEREDLIELFNSKDLLGLGRLGHRLRTRKWQRKVFYALNRHINYTNICHNDCLFCAFKKKEGEGGAYLLGIDEITRLLCPQKGPKVDEVHLVGGCHPDLGLDYYINAIRSIKHMDQGIGIKGLTAVEVAHISGIEAMSVEDVLMALKEAGLSALAGGGAEIFSGRVRQLICKNKISGEEYLKIHEIAHGLGIPSNATMLFGHIETIEERVDHLLALRRLQEKTNGFMAFVPLPFLPQNTGLGDLAPPQAVDILKTIAISRLALPNFPHIKAYWVMLGLRLSSIALSFGADDLEGTVISESIARDAGGEDSSSMTEERIRKLIVEAGFEPQRRTTLYNPQVLEETCHGAL